MSEFAQYAVSAANSRGRIHPGDTPGERSEFQRDLHRVVHSTAFRRLEYKTQVFVNHEGDLFRTRLTHSIEVAQVGRSIARALKLNEDLVEAVSLAHDLGHTPFGHAGQDAMNECMKQYGGFEHNLQSLRVIDLLEDRYAGFDGLNLMFETREGVLKHCSINNAKKLGPLGERFIKKLQPSLEAQIANLADEIAYNNHDVDDGIRSGLLTLDQLMELKIVSRHANLATQAYPGLEGRRLVHETIRRMIAFLVGDLITQSRKLIAEAKPASLDDVHHAAPLIAFSEEVAVEQRELKRFLFTNLYRHYRVMRMSEKARRIVTDLFNAFIAEPRLLPPQDQHRIDGDPARAIADYVAGMTDRYAMREHRRLFAVDEI
jgi:dGTPase